MQYIYRKYGCDRAALTAAVTTYRPRSALREAGKALGVDPAIVDRVAKQHHWFDSRADLLQRFAEAGLDPEAPLNQQWAAFAAQLLGYPRHLSQHSGGFVISRGKLTRLVPVENAAMEDRSIIQWDKDDIEALGILKIDVLALGMLSMVRRALDMIWEKRGETFELQDIPAEDKATYDMLCDGDSMGVFQVESRAQMSMLPRLRPQCFYDLVIEVAIVRPGPVQGGMVQLRTRLCRAKECETIMRVFGGLAIAELKQRLAKEVKYVSHGAEAPSLEDARAHSQENTALAVLLDAASTLVNAASSDCERLHHRTEAGAGARRCPMRGMRDRARDRHERDTAQQPFWSLAIVIGTGEYPVFFFCFCFMYHDLTFAACTNYNDRRFLIRKRTIGMETGRTANGERRVPCDRWLGRMRARVFANRLAHRARCPSRRQGKLLEVVQSSDSARAICACRPGGRRPRHFRL
ncbi:putative DNA polymerase subunit alpha [Burkholderia diffusa]|uniref:Putative DNA polymerase subunit alpha n=1 Tax=Burkholderia diffusa TaxID=488732 RepID=A0A6P2PTX4_9BURK|nr:putative DNA polymerase subunit alpha [Burkholderia diffusa]